jgi:shikimate dehydrogenase
MLTGSARLAGIVGWPVAHSRSPRLHGFWLERMGIDGAYLPLPVRPGDFSVAIHGLRAAGFRGCNVTLPHKQAAFAICDQRDASARRSGTVNTLVFDGGKILGHNTDGPGFIASLQAHGIDAKAGPVLVLGAGGAARAVAAALQDAGAVVSLANRTHDRATALAQVLPGLRVVPWQQREAALGDFAMLVNATAAGMSGHEALPLDLARAAPAMTVADIVYVPIETPLLVAAAACGLRTVGGLGMLLHQAGLGFEAWFGARPEVDDALEAFVAADIARR